MAVVDSLLRGIFGALDKGIYWAIEILMQLTMDLSNLSIFSDSVINNFATRIYIILGLVMLFKIMISFIQILINPEKMDDKEQGVGGVLKRVVISLALIYLVPSIFDLARQVQTQVVTIIPKVILGNEISPDSTNESSQEAMASVGRMMAFYTFMPFFNYDNANCNDGSIMGTGNDDNATIWSVGTALEAKFATCQYSTDANTYKYNYRFPWSTLVGAYVVWVLGTIAVATAIRAIKLAVCEFISPIPIASYIDPKTSGQAFNGWVKASTTTYLDLFIRLIIIYFIIFVFQSFLGTDNLNYLSSQFDDDALRSSLIVVFVIVGLLQFAKQAPKFIGDMLGFQNTGDILKGMLTGEGWKQAAGAVAPVAGGLVAGAGNAWNAGVHHAGFWRGLRSTIAGAGSGFWNGAKVAATGETGGKVFNRAVQKSWSRRNLRAADRAAGVNIFDRMAVGARDWANIQDDISLAGDIRGSISEVQSADKEYKSVFNDKLNKKASETTWSGIQNGRSKTVNDLRTLFNQNAAAIGASNNQTLIDALNTLNNNGLKANGKYLSFGDLSSLSSSAQAAGIGSIASQLSSTGDLYLAAQKEIQNDGRTHHVMTVDGNSSDLNTDQSIGRALTGIRQKISDNFANLGRTEYTDSRGNKHVYASVDDYVRAYENDSSTVDDALTARDTEISAKIASSKTSAARSSNQRWKGSNGN